MFVRLYNFSTNINDYSHNGLGSFDTIQKSEVVEVLNDEYTLSMSILKTDRLAGKVLPNMCIKAKPNPFDDPQIFVVTRVNFKNASTVDIEANHIKNLYFNNVIYGDKTDEGITYTGTPAAIMAQIDNDAVLPNIFNFTSDIVTSGSIRSGIESKTYGDLFTTEGGMRDVFRGDLKFDNFNVSFLSHRGSEDAKRVLRTGVNISQFSRETNNFTEYTHVLPFADVPTVEGYDLAQSVRLYGNIARASQSNFSRIYLKDFTSRFTSKRGYVNPTTGSGYTEARQNLTTWGGQYVTNRPSIKTPSINITVKIEPSNSGLEDVALGDKVKVIDEQTNYSAEHRIIKAAYDPVMERYNSLELSSRKYSLYNYLKGR